jgi:hypothetical protein
MSAPKGLVLPGCLRVDLVPETLRFDFENPADERGGEVTAELALYSTAPSSPGLLYRARLNLTSTRSRDDLARHLTARVGRGEWAAWIDAACTEALRLHRLGTPPRRLAEIERPAPAAFLDRHGLLLDRLPVIWFGDGGDLKSYLALAAAVSIAGVPALPGVTSPRPRRVLYLDWELSGDDHRERLERLAPGEDPDVLYLAVERPLTAEVARLRRLVDAEGIEFIVVDSAGFAADGPPEAAEAALGFFRALRQVWAGRPGGSLIIAHTTKGGEGDQKPFGSVFWANSARATWFVKRSAEPATDGEIVVGLFPRKPPAVAAPQRAVAFRFVFEDERTRIEPADVAVAADLATRLPLRERVAAAVRFGARTYDEIAEAAGLEPNEVRSVVSRYGGLFVKLAGPDGRVRVGLRGPEERN